MQYIYWIHLDTHTDPYTQGYVGISKQPKKRFRAHTTDTSGVGSKVVQSVIAEYGVAALKHTILDTVDTLQAAKVIESAYRPQPNIGWNLATGGGSTPDCTGRKHTQETKDKIATGNVNTKATRKYVSPFKGMIDRYSLEQRALIGSYHKGKTITQEHIDSMRIKLSGSNSPAAKRISVKDLMTNEVRSFDTITEAAKSLQINLSTLKSAVIKPNRIVYRRWLIVDVQGKG